MSRFDEPYAQGQMPAAAANAPGDHLSAGFHSFMGGLQGGVIPAIAGGLGGLMTGQLNGPMAEVARIERNS